MPFLNFYLFFPNFKWLLLKISQWISRVLRKFYYVIDIFELHIFDNETAALLNLFEICTKMHFVSLFFLKERNIKTSILVIHLKYAVLHYANLNSSSINKALLNYGLLNILFRFFPFLVYVYFNKEILYNKK